MQENFNLHPSWPEDDPDNFEWANFEPRINLDAFSPDEVVGFLSAEGPLRYEFYLTVAHYPLDNLERAIPFMQVLVRSGEPKALAAAGAAIRPLVGHVYRRDGDIWPVMITWIELLADENIDARQALDWHLREGTFDPGTVADLANRLLDRMCGRTWNPEVEQAWKTQTWEELLRGLEDPPR